MEGSIKDLSTYRYEKAKRNLEIAEMLIGEDAFDFSLNRSYYSVFDAMRAVNALDGFDSSKHSGVIAYFNQHFLKTGKLDPSLSAIIKQASSLREKSDYEDFYRSTREEAEDTLEQAQRFIKAVGSYLQAEDVFNGIGMK